MTAPRAIFARRDGHARRRQVGLAVMIALAALWLGLASRVHVNASWSDQAWGYAAFPLFGEDPRIGDRVLFEPGTALNAPVPYLKTVRGVPGMRIEIGPDRTVFLDGVALGRAKTRALDGGRSKPSHRGSSRPAVTSCMPIIPTATTAATPKSVSCRASASSAAPSPCPTCPGSD